MSRAAGIDALGLTARPTLSSRIVDHHGPVRVKVIVTLPMSGVVWGDQVPLHAHVPPSLVLPPVPMETLLLVVDDDEHAPSRAESTITSKKRVIESLQCDNGSIGRYNYRVRPLLGRSGTASGLLQFSSPVAAE